MAKRKTTFGWRFYGPGDKIIARYESSAMYGDAVVESLRKYCFWYAQLIR